jgi:hypothetical protein
MADIILRGSMAEIGPVRRYSTPSTPRSSGVDAGTDPPGASGAGDAVGRALGG